MGSSFGNNTRIGRISDGHHGHQILWDGETDLSAASEGTWYKDSAIGRIDGGDHGHHIAYNKNARSPSGIQGSWYQGSRIGEISGGHFGNKIMPTGATMHPAPQSVPQQVPVHQGQGQNVDNSMVLRRSGNSSSDQSNGTLSTAHT